MAHLYNNKHYSPLVWVDGSHGSLPPNAVVGGTEHRGDPIYVGRSAHDGDTMVGKVCPASRACYVAYRGEQLHQDYYQVLCNPHHTPLAWVWVNNGPMPTGAIIGGQEKDGTPLFIGRVVHEGSLCVGKVNPNLRTLYYPMHQEHATQSFEVLVAQTLNTSHSAY